MKKPCIDKRCHLRIIAGEEKSVPVFKASNDRLTFLLGGDSAGDFKEKTRLIYYFEYFKSTLPVLHK